MCPHPKDWTPCLAGLQQYSQTLPARAATTCRCAGVGNSAIGKRFELETRHQLIYGYLADVG